MLLEANLAIAKALRDSNEVYDAKINSCAETTGQEFRLGNGEQQY